MAFSIGLATLKYKEGLAVVGMEGDPASCLIWQAVLTVCPGSVVPKPFETWTPAHQKMLRPLMVLIGLSWALEMYCFGCFPARCKVTDLKTIRSFSIIHLGELCRWFFLFNTMLSEGLWLRSKYLHAWIFGSVTVGLYISVIAGVSSNNGTKVRFNFHYRCLDLIALKVQGVDLYRRKCW